MRTLLVIAIVCFAAQLVDGALGTADGVTSSSLMLAIGLSPAAASASVHLSELGTTLVSGASHWKFGNVDWRMVVRLGVPGAIGAFAGATFLSGLSTEAATPWMAAILLVLGLYVLLRFTFGRIAATGSGRPLRSRFLAPLGLVAGFIDATGGGGWGPGGHADAARLGSRRAAQGRRIGRHERVLVAVAASIGFFVGIGDEGVEMGDVLALLAGGLLAAPLAAYLVRRIAPKVLGSLVGGIIVLANSRSLVRQFGIEGIGAAAIYLAVVAGWIAAIASSAAADDDEWLAATVAYD